MERCRAYLFIKGIGFVTALIDTGATISAVHSSIVRKKVKFEPKMNQITTADGSQMVSEAICSLTVEYKDQLFPFEFVVFPSMPYHLIVGEDFLDTYNAVSDMQKSQVVGIVTYLSTSR